MDLWANLSTYSCATCRFFVPKGEGLGRCRRNAPTMDGYPVVYDGDWCGQHKMGTNPSREKMRDEPEPEPYRQHPLVPNDDIGLVKTDDEPPPYLGGEWPRTPGINYVRVCCASMAAHAKIHHNSNYGKRA